MTPIQQITLVGAGLMGHGIALDFALAGYPVTLHDLDKTKLDQAMGKIRRSLQLLAAAGRIPAEGVEAISARVCPGTDLRAAVSQADLIVESVFEDLALKQTVFKELDQASPPHAILASNTSSFPPTQLAAATTRPDKVLVAHYFNPPYLLPLVEVVKGEATSAETVARVCSLLVQAGKQPVLLKREVAGFIANRLQAALVREAMSIVSRGIAEPQDVDTVIRCGFGRRLAAAGVFEVLDLAGLDLALAVAAALLPDLDSSPEVPAWFREKVQRGELGAKTGSGFYPWTPDSAAGRSRALAHALLHLSQLPNSPRPDA